MSKPSTKPRKRAAKAAKPAYRKGQTITMLFHYAGMTSEERYQILKVSRDGRTITIDSDDDEAKCFRFDTRTGNCLNDETWGRARRELKLIKAATPSKRLSLEAREEPSVDE